MNKLFLTFFFVQLFTASFAQSQLSITDTRNLGTAPDTYNNLMVPYFKAGSSIGLPSSGTGYYTLLGMRGWYDNTGGKAHELAFGDENRVFLRSGYSPSWGAWRQFVTTDENGNVGIGTNSPINGLHVFSFNNLQGGSIRFGHSGSDDAVLSFGWNGVDQDVLKIGKFSHNSTANETTFMTMKTTNGNVGIGTNDPDEKLTVKGGIHARSVKVDLNGPLADYVFEADYKLRSLTDLHSYIKRFHHLPEVPSAKEAQSNGLDLGTMNQVLLKKVEELTLYVIHQSKEIKQMKTQILKLKNKPRTKK